MTAFQYIQYFQTTSSMVSETVNEFLELWMFVKGKVDTGFMKTAEVKYDVTTFIVHARLSQCRIRH